MVFSVSRTPRVDAGAPFRCLCAQLGPLLGHYRTLAAAVLEPRDRARATPITRAIRARGTPGASAARPRRREPPSGDNPADEARARCINFYGRWDTQRIRAEYSRVWVPQFARQRRRSIASRSATGYAGLSILSSPQG